MHQNLYAGCRFALGMVLFLALGSSAQAGSFQDGRLRLEINGVGGIYSGKTDRSGDYYVGGSVEYEWAAFKKASLGLRFYPLFVYPEPKPVYGVAGGVTARIYKNQEERNGLFAEVGSAVLWHSRYFKENNSRINFLSEIGVGYQFPKNDWHLALKYHHISNAGLASENAGINGVGLSVGYKF
ncbi:MAG: acyloxyacyl hydrolase [Candidatus Hydrogenedentes bacterium]|nr:acyloxyacyl hydrolase [Candidatus Hydrogenedentota bacterium]